MFIVYHSHDETLVTTRSKEKKFLKEFFPENTDRILDEYDREEICDSGLKITASVFLR